MKQGSYMSQEDIQEYLLAGTRTNKKRRIRYEQGKQKVIKSKKDLEEFVRNAVSKKGIEEFAVYGKVWTELGEKVILASHGTVNIFGKYLELSSTDLWHAFYNHQTAKEIGNMDLTFDELIYALDNINDSEVEKVVKRENGKYTKSSPNSVGNLRSVNTTRFGTTLIYSISNYPKKTTCF